MSIIISKNGINAKKLDKISFGLEDNLQQYIYDNPDSIPLYDIKDDVRLLILAREFGTSSGPIDALGIDADGEIYLVETKLYKNPDKRTVVAQVLDYGASLWKHFTDFDELLLKLNTHVQKKFGESINDKLSNYFNLTEEDLERVLDNMRKNLDQGNFKFVVLMDSLEDRLKDLILYINQNSAFDIYGVELEYYKHDSFEIIIPKLYGAQVKKEVSSKKSNTIVFTEDDYIDTFSKIGFGKQIGEVLKLHQQIADGTIKIVGIRSKKTPKNINFYCSLHADGKTSFTISVGINGNSPDKTLSFWCENSTYFEKILNKIQTYLNIKVDPMDKVKPGIIARWELQSFDTQKLLSFLKNLQ